MYLAIDDTDSRIGGCTTYILTEIIRRSGLEIAGYPRLVRLNPSIPWKTRGNGALAVRLVNGGEKGEKIGEIDGEDYFCNENSNEDIDQESLLELAAETIYDLAFLDEEGTNPGIVISREQPGRDLYEKCVQDVADIETVRRYLDARNIRYLGIKNSRGIIGAAASLSWVPMRKTFEALLYKYPSSPPIPHEIKMMAALEAQKIKGSFNNVDIANRYPAIMPRERTPVVMGIRSVDHLGLLKGLTDLARKYGIAYDRAFLFETNQGTDDHIVKEPGSLQNFQSYSLNCSVVSFPRVISGSHYFIDVMYGSERLKAAAFEPTKEFRKIFGKLAPGDSINIFGTYDDGTINVEKMDVKAMARIYTRVPPICNGCGTRMISRGYGDYRCKKCGERTTKPHYIEEERPDILGKHDVPVIARRHLSMPYSLEGSI